MIIRAGVVGRCWRIFSAIAQPLGSEFIRDSTRERARPALPRRGEGGALQRLDRARPRRFAGGARGRSPSWPPRTSRPSNGSSSDTYVILSEGHGERQQDGDHRAMNSRCTIPACRWRSRSRSRCDSTKRRAAASRPTSGCSSSAATPTRSRCSEREDRAAARRARGRREDDRGVRDEAGDRYPRPGAGWHRSGSRPTTSPWKLRTLPSARTARCADRRRAAIPIAVHFAERTRSIPNGWPIFRSRVVAAPWCRWCGGRHRGRRGARGVCARGRAATRRRRQQADVHQRDVGGFVADAEAKLATRSNCRPVIGRSGAGGTGTSSRRWLDFRCWCRSPSSRSSACFTLPSAPGATRR